MERPGSMPSQQLPGSDALRTAPYFESDSDMAEARLVYDKRESFKANLNNPVYHKYLRMHKVVVGEAGARQLAEIGDALSQEVMPDFLDAAGWAYAEAALASKSQTTVERIEGAAKAESAWLRALVNELDLSAIRDDGDVADHDTPHRLAMNLAYLPLIKSIIVGNVTKTTMHQVLKDTAEIAMDSSRQLEAAGDDEKGIAIRAQHRGLLFEANALMAMLYMDDPRYVPLPSTARADTGYYHRAQTHDISVINQHWGDIRKVVPVEVKSKASLRDRQRYKAMIIRGKMHLVVEGHDPRPTTEAFHAIANGAATLKQMASIEKLTTHLREMLRQYQQGMTAEGLAVNSLTRFHSSAELIKTHPELTDKYRPYRTNRPAA